MTEDYPMNFRGKEIGLSFAAATATLFFGCAWPHAGLAQRVDLPDGVIACNDFQRGATGSWTVLHPTMIQSQGVEMSLMPGQTFAKNQLVDGIEITTVLDRNCGNE
jgi:hypothetical protein